MDAGEVYAVEIPPSDGHEQAGTRPAIIVQDSQFEARLPTVLLVPLTSRLKARTFPGVYVIHPDDANGLSSESVALVFRLRAIDKRRLKNKIGILSDADLAQVRRQIEIL